MSIIILLAVAAALAGVALLRVRARPRPVAVVAWHDGPIPAAPPAPSARPAAAAPPATARGRASSDDELRATFEGLAQRYQLPPLSTAVTQAMQLTRDPELDSGRLCRVLSADPALTARILALGRSPLYALRRMPETIDDAVRALGVDSLRRLLMTVGMDMLRVRHAREFDLLWRHSFATALAAHGLAARARTWTSDRAYLAGLLHDVADMLLLRADRERFLALWADAAGDQARGLDAERAAYGRDHALLGASILFQWRIDRDVVDVIARHHEADAAPGTHAALLALAEFMASDAGFPFPTPAVRPEAAVFAHYGYDRDEDWTQAVADLQLAVEQEAALLK